ncbi:hypothetical protein ACRQ5Q_14705 [Bradyrhizobium sp. PMVTL-01]|uniref:hypothetical protein n=1 Tax=Bradyrhizobium sp. PMVTL-01 TaxID=3434999 RepID=UPI003F6EE2C2
MVVVSLWVVESALRKRDGSAGRRVRFRRHIGDYVLRVTGGPAAGEDVFHLIKRGLSILPHHALKQGMTGVSVGVRYQKRLASVVSVKEAVGIKFGDRSHLQGAKRCIDGLKDALIAGW